MNREFIITLCLIVYDLFVAIGINLIIKEHYSSLSFNHDFKKLTPKLTKNRYRKQYLSMRQYAKKEKHKNNNFSRQISYAQRWKLNIKLLSLIVNKLRSKLVIFIIKIICYSFVFFGFFVIFILFTFKRRKYKLYQIQEKIEKVIQNLTLLFLNNHLRYIYIYF